MGQPPGFVGNYRLAAIFTLAWHARGQGFKSPILHYKSTEDKHLGLQLAWFDLAYRVQHFLPSIAWGDLVGSVCLLMKALSCLKPTPAQFRIGLHTAASSGLFCFAVGEMTWKPPRGFNREWHAIVENAAPAAQFEAFLLYDLEQASKAAPEAVEVEGPMTVLSRDYFEREEAEPEAAVTCSTGTTWPRSAAPKTCPPLSWSRPGTEGPLGHGPCVGPRLARRLAATRTKRSSVSQALATRHGGEAG